MPMPIAPPQRHSIIRPPVAHEILQAPVRDEQSLGADEDLDREPDGIPHQVVGLTVLFSVMLALLVGFMFISGGTVGRVAAVLLVMVAFPVLVSSLRRKSDRDRDHVHPSR